MDHSRYSSSYKAQARSFKRYKQRIVPFHIYNEYKNYVTRRFKQCKKQHFRDKFDSCTNNIKASWKCINSLIGSKNTKSKYLNITLSNDVVSSDPPLVAECFNNYFVNVGPSLDANIPVNQMSHINFMRQRITNSLYAMPSTPNEVISLISKLTNKPTGIKNILFTFLKDIRI